MSTSTSSSSCLRAERYAWEGGEVAGLGWARGERKGEWGGGETGNRNGNQSPVCGSCWGRGGGSHHHMYAWFCFLGPLWGVEGEASYVMSSRVMPDGQYCIAVSRPRLSVRCEQHVIWRRMVSW